MPAVTYQACSINEILSNMHNESNFIDTVAHELSAVPYQYFRGKFDTVRDAVAMAIGLEQDTYVRGIIRHKQDRISRSEKIRFIRKPISNNRRDFRKRETKFCEVKIHTVSSGTHAIPNRTYYLGKRYKSFVYNTIQNDIKSDLVDGRKTYIFLNPEKCEMFRCAYILEKYD
ncbi:hypothetical protein Trydic_g5829 [Trypoxylus dichotomus]